MLREYQELLLSERTFQAGMLNDTYLNVLEHIDSGIMLFDEDGILTFMNAQMYGLLELKRNSLIGCSISSMLHNLPLTRAKRKQMIYIYKETVLQNKQNVEFPDEYGRYWRVSVTKGDRLDGNYLFVVKEISDYKLIEKTAYENDSLAMLGKLSASIAHEIRNPLTAIRGFIQLLRPHLQQLGKEDYVKIIMAEIDRTNDIIHEFLTCSKPSTPQINVIPVSALLKEVVLLTESEALMKGCQIQLSLCCHDLSVAVDVKQMKQVILNMIRNAMEAVSCGDDDNPGRVEVGVRREGCEARIFVCDNGKGMDSYTMERLFTPFFTTKEKGTGLGLSVSDRIIRNHGGKITVNSRVNEGTNFIISLPLIQ